MHIYELVRYFNESAHTHKGTTNKTGDKMNIPISRN